MDGSGRSAVRQAKGTAAIGCPRQIVLRINTSQGSGVWQRAKINPMRPGLLVHMRSDCPGIVQTEETGQAITIIRRIFSADEREQIL